MQSQFGLREQERPAALRTSMDKHFFEKLVGLATFVVNVTDEVAARVSVPRAKLISGFVVGWGNGDTNLDVEIRSIVIGKDPKYFPQAVITSISKLIADHRQIKATATHEQRGEPININTKVGGRNVGLHLANFEHDVHVFKHYEALMTDRSRAPHHAIQKYKRNRQ